MSEELQPTESPELQLEREKIRRLELEQKARKQTKEAEKAAAEIRQQKFSVELRRQLAATNLQFHCDDAELQQIMQAKGWSFVVQNDGRFNVERDGSQIALKDAVEK